MSEQGNPETCNTLTNFSDFNIDILEKIIRYNSNNLKLNPQLLQTLLLVNKDLRITAEGLKPTTIQYGGFFIKFLSDIIVLEFSKFDELNFTEAEKKVYEYVVNIELPTREDSGHIIKKEIEIKFSYKTLQTLQTYFKYLTIKLKKITLHETEIVTELMSGPCFLENNAVFTKSDLTSITTTINGEIVSYAKNNKIIINKLMLPNVKTLLKGNTFLNLKNFISYLQTDFNEQNSKREEFFEKNDLDNLKLYNLKCYIYIKKQPTILVGLLQRLFSDNQSITFKRYLTFEGYINNKLNKLFSSLKEDNVIETVQKITETETVINESLSLIAPFPHPLTNRSLNSKNMKHLINYINKSKNSGIFSIDKLILMRYLNSWLASSANNNESHNYQQSITHTFTKWHFSQPVFPNNISIKKENCKDNIKLYVHKTENYSIVIMYRDTDDSDISEYDIIQPGIFNSWIDNIMMNNDNISSETSKEGVELEGFEFFPILHAQAQPQANAQANAPGGGAKSAYKRTKNYKQYKLKKYVIYEGKRGGKYIHLNNKYVSLNKIV